MSNNAKEVFTQILEFLVFIAILVFLYFAVCPAFARAENVKPQVGDWVCWVNSKSNPDCGTYGWHKQKQEAFRAADKKCVLHCNSECDLDYCEKLGKETND